MHQTFVYVLSGKLQCGATSLAPGQYAYIPRGSSLTLTSKKSSRAIVIEKLYLDAGEHSPAFLTGDVQAVAPTPMLGDEPVGIQTLLPEDFAFDFAVNTMTFQPGAALPHGRNPRDGARPADARRRRHVPPRRHWYPVTAGDFIWMAPYCPQWFGALGKTPAKYLIYKDWNRHPLTIENDTRLTARTGNAGGIFRCARAGGHARRLFGTGPARARAAEGLCARGGPRGARRRRGQHVRALGRRGAELPAVATGSHIDAIPHSGRYDGTVGVLGGLEAIRALQAPDFGRAGPIELIIFTAEEPTRFGIGCLGSRLLAGVLDAIGRRNACAIRRARRSTKCAPPPGFGERLESVRLARRLLRRIRGAAHRTGAAAGARQVPSAW